MSCITPRKNDKKNVAKVTGVIISIILICVFMYANNSFGIRDMIQSSTLLMRLSQGELSTSALDSNGRFERIIFAIKNIDKIFGAEAIVSVLVIEYTTGFFNVLIYTE